MRTALTKKNHGSVYYLQEPTTCQYLLKLPLQRGMTRIVNASHVLVGIFSNVKEDARNEGIRAVKHSILVLGGTVVDFKSSR